MNETYYIKKLNGSLFPIILNEKKNGLNISVNKNQLTNFLKHN